MDITPENKLPFHCIPNLDKNGGFSTMDSSVVIKTLEGKDLDLNLVVEATREGSDGRKLTGYSVLPAAQVIALWAAFDALGKKHNFAQLVQTQEEFDEERRVRAEASSGVMDRHRQRRNLERSNDDEGPDV